MISGAVVGFALGRVWLLASGSDALTVPYAAMGFIMGLVKGVATHAPFRS